MIFGKIICFFPHHKWDTNGPGDVKCERCGKEDWICGL